MAISGTRRTLLFVIATAAVLVPASLQASSEGCRVAPGPDAILAMPGVPVRADVAATLAPGLELVSPGAVPLVSEDSHACVGKIQPGAPLGNGCTMNWVFRDPTGQLYVGTAGHCGGLDQPMFLPGAALPFGEVVFSVKGEGGESGVGNDFGLIRIDPEFYGSVDPTLCHWGGPNGVGVATLGEQVLVHGHGFIWGDVIFTQPRTGVAVGQSGTTLTYVGLAQSGDSGMPVMDASGDAVGVHTHSLGPNVPVRPDPNIKYGTTVVRAIGLSSAALGVPISLVTSEVPVAFPLGTS